MAFMVDSFVTKMIEGVVEMARQKLVESGFGSWSLKKWNIQGNNADFPELLGYSALFENLVFTGADKFVVHNLSCQLENSKILFDVSIPQLVLSVGKGELNLNIFGANSLLNAKGRVTIIEPRIVGEALFDGPTDNFQFSFRDVQLQFKIKSIRSKVNAKLNDTDYSQKINSFLKKTVPEFIKKHEDEINKGLAAALGLALLKT